jgi:aspartate/methionine/tyrosine aminotransferase
MELVRRLAARYSPKFGRELDALNEITITVGASEALFALMQGLVNPGDEVIILEPAFDLYAAQSALAGELAVRRVAVMSANEHC